MYLFINNRLQFANDIKYQLSVPKSEIGKTNCVFFFFFIHALIHCNRKVKSRTTGTAIRPRSEAKLFCAPRIRLSSSNGRRRACVKTCRRTAGGTPTSRGPRLLSRYFFATVRPGQTGRRVAGGRVAGSRCGTSAGTTAVGEKELSSTLALVPPLLSIF